jgi:hypothetical protein
VGRYSLPRTESEPAFTELKSEVSPPLIYHKDARLQAPIFLALVAYSLKAYPPTAAAGVGLRAHASGGVGRIGELRTGWGFIGPPPRLDLS